MKKTLQRSLILSVALAASLLLGATATAVAQTSPTTDDLQQRIDDLQKQITDLKARMSAAPAPAPAPAAATPVAAPAPAAPSISSLLGPTTLTGLVDAYYGYNSNTPANYVNGTQPFTPFNNQFGLNLIELGIAKAPDATSRTGYTVSLGFGQAMNTVNGSDPAGLNFAQYLKEGYFSYLAPVGKGLQLDVGKFVTPAGAEVIESNANWNYTRSVLFYYAIPYFHYGLRAKYTINDKASLTGYLVNGWNNIVDTNSGKTAGVTLGLNPTKKVAISQTVLFGPEQPASSDPGGPNSTFRQLWDTVITYSPTGKLSLMVNGDYGRGDRYCLVPGGSGCITPSSPASWYGAAGYVKYAFNPKYTVAFRYEFFQDPDGFATGQGQHWQEGTFTFERDIASHIISRIEYRHDETSLPYFQQGTSGLVKGQNTASLGLMYTFTTAQ